MTMFKKTQSNQRSLHIVGKPEMLFRKFTPTFCSILTVMNDKNQVIHCARNFTGTIHREKEKAII